MSKNSSFKMFSNANGFNKHKNVAINLLTDIINILDKFNIDYFLISGTLLGFQRHGDFIPWDDDIDIIVSDDFYLKYNEIIASINKNHIFFSRNKYVYKFSYSDKLISHCDNKYYWPFVDIFTFYKSENSLDFFNKKWNINEFYPIKKMLFNGIIVNVPFNPDYFLKINYGDDYMTIFKSNEWNHRYECQNIQKKTITLNEYKIIK